MTNPIYYQNQPLLPVTNNPNQQVGKPSKTNNAINQQVSFNQVLQQEMQQVKFSQHAIQRLQSRNMNLDSSQLSKLNQAVDKAAQKGARESLVLMNNMAFVVSIKNRTVITAMDENSMKENVFTNIDSAVVV